MELLHLGKYIWVWVCPICAVELDKADETIIHSILSHKEHYNKNKGIIKPMPHHISVIG